MKSFREYYLGEAHAPLAMHKPLIDGVLDKIEVEESRVRMMELIGVRTARGANAIVGAPTGSLKGRLQRLMGSIRALTREDIFRQYEDIYGVTPDARAEQLLQINPNWNSKKDGPLDERLEKLFDKDPRNQQQKIAQDWINAMQKTLAHNPETAFMAVLDPERKAMLMEYLRKGVNLIFDIPNMGQIDPNDPKNDPNQDMY